jgi:hypothetical protein
MGVLLEQHMHLWTSILWKRNVNLVGPIVQELFAKYVGAFAVFHSNSSAACLPFSAKLSSFRRPIHSLALHDSRSSYDFLSLAHSQYDIDYDHLLIYTRQMPASVPIPANLGALPDAVLRYMADFMPLSGLLVLVRCNQRLQTVLQHQLSRRLDDLFALSTQHIPHTAGHGVHFELSISVDDLKRKMEALFGMGNMWSNNNYVFIEAPKGYDGSLQPMLSRFPYVQDSWGGRNLYRVLSPNFSPHRFTGWLHRRYNRLLAAEASSEEETC